MKTWVGEVTTIVSNSNTASAINRFLDYVFYIPMPACQKSIRSCFRWLWLTMWLLGMEPKTTERAARALNCWAISPARLFSVCLLLNISWLLWYTIRILDIQAVEIKRPAWTITCLNKYVIKYEATGSLSGWITLF